jgi:hypothetical protein
MLALVNNDDVPVNDRLKIRMLSERLLFARDQTERNDLREHLRSEIHEARKLRTAHKAVRR